MSRRRLLKVPLEVQFGLPPSRPDEPGQVAEQPVEFVEYLRPQAAPQDAKVDEGLQDYADVARPPAQ